MKLSRDAWLGIGILLALVIVTSAAALQQADATQIPYLSTSSAPNGTLALKLWLDELGYDSTETPIAGFAPSSEVKTIFVIQPIYEITVNEWKLLDQWLEQGGTLILAGDNGPTDAAMSHFDFSIAYLNQHADEILPAAPILKSPLLASKVPLQADFGLYTRRTDFIPLMAAKNLTVIVAFREGKGRVILSATPDIFTNLTLKDDSAATLTLNLIALANEKGTVWFDEWHHGFQTASIVGPGMWLRNTPGGHAIMFAVFAVFIALLLQGRGFGRPVPLKHEIKRRGPIEHVTAIANLNRKAGHSSEVLNQYHHRLKRHLGQRYRLDPSMRDEEYAEALAHFNSSIDKEELLRLLKRLSQKNVSEAELLKISADAAKWMSE